MKITEDTTIRELAMVLRTRKLSVVASCEPDGWLLEKVHPEDVVPGDNVWADGKTFAQALDKLIKKVDNAGDR